MYPAFPAYPAPYYGPYPYDHPRYTAYSPYGPAPTSYPTAWSRRRNDPLPHDPYSSYYRTPVRGWHNLDNDEEEEYPQTPFSRSRFPFDAARSTRPHPHRLLKYNGRSGPALNFDVAQTTRNVTVSDGTRISSHDTHRSAFSSEVTQVRLVCEDLPWILEISRTGWDSGITVQQVIESIRSLRTTALGWSEIILAGKRKRESMKRVHRERLRGSPDSEPKGLCQVDWLEGKTKFLGLRKDDRVVKALLDPFHEDVVETWVMIFG